MKRVTGLLLTLAAFGVQAGTTDLICSMDEINKTTDEVSHTDNVPVSVPDQSTRNVRALSYYNSDRIIEEWEITPTHSNYRFRKIIDGDIIKYEASSIEAATGKVVGSTNFDPPPFLRIRGHKAKETSYSGQCYLAPEPEAPAESEK